MLKRFTISLDEKLLEQFDNAIKQRKYVNRSEAIRDLIRSAFSRKIGRPELGDLGRIEIEKAFEAAFLEGVNNAGVRTAQAPLWEMTPQEWDTMIAVNLRGAFLCCREVLPGMIERRSGHVINVISTVSQIGIEQMSGYSASKWGLLGMTKSLVKEARPYGVRVSAISPGGTDSTFRSTPRPDYLAPETVAEAIVFVASLPEKAVVHDLIVRPMVETNF